MPKRFTDSNKWQDVWFMELKPDYKMLWFYLLDTCDHAGIWKVNLKLARCMLRKIKESQKSQQKLFAS